MRPSAAILALTLAAGVRAIQTPRRGVAIQSNNNTALEPKKYIVEFDQNVGNHDDLVMQIASRPGARVTKTFKSEIFSGVTVETDGDNIDTLMEIGFVINTWHSKIVTLAQPIKGQSFSDDAAASNFSTHALTGVSKLHEAGILGKGAVVAIVDTGTDYSHPALGNCFGEGCKVAGGWDFVGDSMWPLPGWEKEPDADPRDGMYHGTHVAGIVAGKLGSFVGVAPDATILSYKVFGRIDNTDEETIIEAFLMAYEDGADIITASLGQAYGFSDDPWAIVASRLVDKGVLVTIAAGNNGREGAFYGDSGSSGENVLAVASVETSELPSLPFYATFNLDGVSNKTTVAYSPSIDPWPESIQYEIVPLSFDTTVDDQACKKLPANTPDLSDKVVLVRRSKVCSYITQQGNLEAAGAQNILIYNNDWPIENPSIRYWTSLVGGITAEAGKAIIETVQAGGTVISDFSPRGLNDDWYVGLGLSLGGLPNDWTTMGGLYDLKLKPDIAAPGGDIFSTVPVETGASFAVLSGTSMATPYIAGVAALWVGKYGGRKVHGPEWAKNLAARLTSTAASVQWWDQTFDYNGKPTDLGFFAPPMQVGTGLVNAPKVLDYDTQLSYARFALNDTRHFSRYHNVDVTNNGKETVTYTFKLQPAGGFEAFEISEDGQRIKQYRDLVPQQMVPSVKFPSGTFKVKPGQTRNAQFTFAAPADLKSETLPVYSGKILIFGDNGEQLSVPYFGLGSDLGKELNMLDHAFAFSGWFGETHKLEEMSTFSFNLSVEAQDYPRVYSRLNWGCEEIRFDIFEANYRETDWRYPPVEGKNKFIGSAAVYNVDVGILQEYFDPEIDSITDTYSFPILKTPRHMSHVYDFQYWWMGRLSNGSFVVPGNYKWRIAYLKPFARPEASDNWDIYKTPTITVLTQFQ